MPYLAMDFFTFPDGADQQAVEAALKSHSPNILFAGRVVQDPSRRFTHAIVWQFEDFEDYQAGCELFIATLNEDGSNAMDYPPYKADHWWGCKLVDFDDPVLVEHGLEEWSRRDLQPLIDHAKTDKRVAAWMTGLGWFSMNNGDQPHRAAEYWLREQAGLPFKE